MIQLLSDPAKAAGFSKLVFDMLKLARWGEGAAGLWKKRWNVPVLILKNNMRYLGAASFNDESTKEN
jgi:hypothetical protein